MAHDEDHHAAHHREDDAKDQVCEDGLQHGKARDAADRLRQPGEERPKEGLGRAAGRIVEGHRDAHALGDVVHRDCHAEARADPGVIDRRQEGCESLWEVVYPDGERGHDAHASEALLLLGIGHVGCRHCRRIVCVRYHHGVVRSHRHLDLRYLCRCRPCGAACTTRLVRTGRRRRLLIGCRAFVLLMRVATGEPVRGAHIRVCTAATSAQPVDKHLEQRAEKHTAEEAGGRHRDGAALAEASIGRRYGCERLDEDLDE